MIHRALWPRNRLSISRWNSATRMVLKPTTPTVPYVSAHPRLLHVRMKRAGQRWPSAMPGIWPACEPLTGQRARWAFTIPSAARTATRSLSLGNHTGVAPTLLRPRGHRDRCARNSSKSIVRPKPRASSLNSASAIELEQC